MAKPQPSQSNASQSNDLAPIIIKKIKKGGHGGHHGGAWKVAYADFVTAMMAFFLLMWLLNATSQEQRQGISNYFDPIGVSQGASGAGGVLGGKTIAEKGTLQSASAPPIPSPPLGAPESTAGEEDGSPITTTEETDQENPLTAKPNKNPSAEDIKKEEDDFKKVETALRQAIQETPDLKDLMKNLIIEQTPEGLRIQIVDQDQKSMFPVGSSTMYSYTQKLLQQVAKVIVSLPNKIQISGHTDSLQYAQRNTYTNWELSTDRANASRRELVNDGLSPARLAYIAGKADTEPLDKKNPASAINRRISIVLLKQALTQHK